MEKKYNVDSFNLDHTKVTAPFVRLAAKKVGEKGDIVTKFDIRFCQPNKEFMSTGAIHTLEHLMAEYIRDEMEGCAIAQTCYLNKVPFVIVRCMSDMADDTVEQTYSFNEDICAEACACLVKKIIEVL